MAEDYINASIPIRLDYVDFEEYDEEGEQEKPTYPYKEQTEFKDTKVRNLFNDYMTLCNSANRSLTATTSNLFEVNAKNVYSFIHRRIEISIKHFELSGIHSLTKNSVDFHYLASLRRLAWHDCKQANTNFNIGAWEDMKNQIKSFVKSSGLPEKKRTFFSLTKLHLAYILKVGPQGASWFPSVALFFAGVADGKRGCGLNLMQ